MRAGLGGRLAGLAVWLAACEFGLAAPGVAAAQPADAAASATSARALFASGFDLLQAHNVAGAIKDFQAGLQLDPTDALAHFYLAQAWQAAGDDNRAYSEYRKSLKLNIQEPQASAAKAQLANPGRPPQQTLPPPPTRLMPPPDCRGR